MRVDSRNTCFSRLSAALGLALTVAVGAPALASTTTDRTLTIPATAETRTQVGVETWKCEKVGRNIRVVGYGAESQVKASFSFSHDDASAQVESTFPSAGIEKRSRDGEVMRNTLSADAQRLVAAFSQDKDAMQLKDARTAPATTESTTEATPKLVPVNDPQPQVCFRRSKGCWGIVEWCTDQDIFGRDCGGWYRCGWCFGFW